MSSNFTTTIICIRIFCTNMPCHLLISTWHYRVAPALRKFQSHNITKTSWIFLLLLYLSPLTSTKNPRRTCWHLNLLTSCQTQPTQTPTTPRPHSTSFPYLCANPNPKTLHASDLLIFIQWPQKKEQKNKEQKNCCRNLKPPFSLLLARKMGSNADLTRAFIKDVKRVIVKVPSLFHFSFAVFLQFARCTLHCSAPISFFKIFILDFVDLSWKLWLLRRIATLLNYK